MLEKSLSRVRLFVILWTVAYQAPLFMEFSRQEYWSGLPFPSPGDLLDPGIKPRLLHLLHCRWILNSQNHLGSLCVLVMQSCPALCDPMDYSPLGSSVHEILQARIILEWVGMPSSRGSSWPRDWTWVSCITGRLLSTELQGKLGSLD